MRSSRLLALILCLLMVFSGFAAFAETEDPYERIAELEAEVERLQGYRLMCIVAEFDGGEVLVSEVQEEYDYYIQMYTQYGIDVAGLGLDVQLKTDIINTYVSEAVMLYMAEQLGVGQLTEEEMNQVQQAVTENYEANVNFYAQNFFAGEGVTEEAAIGQAVAYLDGMGMGYEAMLDATINSSVLEAVYNHMIADVTVEDSDLMDAYNTFVEEDQANFGESIYAFEAAVSNGDLICWRPEGFRYAQHILFAFDDEQTLVYNDLTTALTTLEEELANATAPAEEAAADHDHDNDGEPDHAADSAEAQAEQTASAIPAPRDVATIESDIAAVNAELEALYAELMPEAEAAIERFNNGEDFIDLMTELSDSPVIQQQGYVVGPTTEYFVPAFGEGLASIEQIGQISEPVESQFGLHILYYLGDVPAGPVPFEEVRDQIHEICLTTLTDEAYNSTLEAWMEELNVVLYLDNLK